MESGVSAMVASCGADGFFGIYADFRKSQRSVRKIMEIIMAGEMVIARGYNGAAYVRKVLSIVGRAAIICPPESYDAIIAGKEDAPLVGFPIGDVFQFEPAAGDAVAAGKQPQWERLRPLATGGA
jgi:hypothetical protein